MKLKFGDPESIRIKNRGIVISLMVKLKCPNCRSSKYSMSDMFLNSIDWKCSCGSEFVTDPYGKVLRYLNTSLGIVVSGSKPAKAVQMEPESLRLF